MTPRQEYSNDRDLSYSAWHRTLTDKCCAMNLDWIEFRFKNNTPTVVAIIEDKDDRANDIAQWKAQLFRNIAKALDVPAYLVYHNVCRRRDHSMLWQFKVRNLTTEETQIMTEPQYRQFIEKL